MKKVVTMVGILAITSGSANMAQSKEQASVSKASVKLKEAMLSGDSMALYAITWPQLSYGHSGGHIDSHSEFISKLSSGASDFVSIDISNQRITVLDNTAIERHHLDAQTNDGGKAGTVSLDILLVWKKDKKDWKLLARQAVKSR